MKKIFQNIAALFLILTVTGSVAGVNISSHECAITGDRDISLSVAGPANSLEENENCPYCSIDEQSSNRMEEMHQESENSCCGEESSDDFAVELKKDHCCIEHNDYLAGQFDIKLNEENELHKISLKISGGEYSSPLISKIFTHKPSLQRPPRLPCSDTYLHFIGVMLS